MSVVWEVIGHKRELGLLSCYRVTWSNCLLNPRVYTHRLMLHPAFVRESFYGNELRGNASVMVECSAQMGPLSHPHQGPENITQEEAGRTQEPEEEEMCN